MAEIRLHITQERLDSLTVDDMIAVENVGEGRVSTKALRAILAKFCLDGDRAYLPESEAAKLIGKITRPRFFEVVREFLQKVNDLAVNPTNADGSTPGNPSGG